VSPLLWIGSCSQRLGPQLWHYGEVANPLGGGTLREEVRV
jgi:hypothetical protein